MQFNNFLTATFHRCTYKFPEEFFDGVGTGQLDKICLSGSMKSIWDDARFYIRQFAKREFAAYTIAEVWHHISSERIIKRHIANEEKIIRKLVREGIKGALINLTMVAENLGVPVDTVSLISRDETNAIRLEEEKRDAQEEKKGNQSSPVSYAQRKQQHLMKKLSDAGPSDASQSSLVSQ